MGKDNRKCFHFYVDSATGICNNCGELIFDPTPSDKTEAKYNETLQVKKHHPKNDQGRLLASRGNRTK